MGSELPCAKKVAPVAESKLPPLYIYLPSPDSESASASAKFFRNPALHPAVVAASELLVCLLALVAFSRPLEH